MSGQPVPLWIVRSAGLAGSVCGLAILLWLFATQPATIEQVRGGLASAVGAYHVNDRAFAEGLVHFRADRFVEARLAFDRADPAQRDATTQFYVAYAYFRQGWGRIAHDDDMMRRAAAALDRAVAASASGVVRVNDPLLSLQTSDRLRAEIESGLTRDLSDLNPLRVLRERP